MSLQALRALAFLGIFLFHAGATIFWSSLGVSIFFVLSGCLMYYQYDNKDISHTLKENILFSWKKIKKLYPLHIITMCIAIILYLKNCSYTGFTVENLRYLLLTVGLNVMLLQTWVPDNRINVSLNGVAWYLSAAAFLYLMFPYIKKWIKNKADRLLLFICMVLLFVEIFTCTAGIYLLGEESHVYIWFMYCFPVFRLVDFFMGCCLGKYYVEKGKQKKLSFSRASVYEILVTLITIWIHIWVMQKQQNIFLKATQNWTTLYIPLAVVWVLLFFYNKGIITKLLTNKLTIFIGNISADAFLIHFVITQCTALWKSFSGTELLMWENLLLIAVEFVLTIAITWGYMRICRTDRNV